MRHLVTTDGALKLRTPPGRSQQKTTKDGTTLPTLPLSASLTNVLESLEKTVEQAMPSIDVLPMRLAMPSKELSRMR